MTTLPAPPGIAHGGRGERGMAAGAEALALGCIVLVVASVLVVNAWAVLDTRTALESAAREYLRAYTEADSPGAAAGQGRRSARMVLDERPALAADVRISPPEPDTFGPCAPALVTLSAEVPAIRIPFIDHRWGRHTVTVRAVELIDAHQEMTSGADHEPTRTACGG